MRVWDIRIEQLSDTMRSHLAWYLDAKTCTGYVTAIHIANCHGKHGESTLLEVLKFGGLSERKAKIHAGKIMKYGSKQICPQCNGEGSYEGKTGGSEGIPEADVMFVCNECGGTGKIIKL